MHTNHRTPKSSGRQSVIGRAAAVTAVTIIGAAFASAPAGAAGDHRGGHVFAITNEATGNHLLVLDRAANGSLGLPVAIPTGGTGIDAGLGSQGAVTVSEDGRWVVAVNPGSDDVSLFRVGRDGATLIDTESSGGDQPVSVDVRGNLVYVVNAGTGNNVSGLRIRPGGLDPIPGSTRPLSAEGAAPAQVSFTPDGRHLVVTEKATNSISTFAVERGVAQPGIANASTGVTPFGFAFDRFDHLVVSNANGGAASGSSASTYDVGSDGALVPLDGPDATNQTAACWIAISENGRYAYTTNTGSASITGYGVDRDGSLDLLDADGVTGVAGNGPTDFGFSRDGRYLYTLNSGDDSISIHRADAWGGLAALGTVTGLPASTAGVVAD